jgi:hypothetical protein
MISDVGPDAIALAQILGETELRPHGPMDPWTHGPMDPWTRLPNPIVGKWECSIATGRPS